MKILHILNTLLLAGILATLILIVLHLQKPVRVSEPVSIEGYARSGLLTAWPDPEPVEVRIIR